jgi:outer membrane protein insertion porin family
MKITSVLLKFLYSLVVLALLNSQVAAQEFVIEDIRVEGLQRLTAGTIFNYLPLEVGDTYTNQTSVNAVSALFRTGFFEDVRLERDGNVLVVVIEERPAIGSINLSGNEDVKTEDIMENLETIGFAVGRTFEQSQLDTLEKELRRVYFSQGKYGVTIKSTVTPLGNNRVAVDIELAEGKAAKIKQINIVGNRSFSEKILTKAFELKPPTLLSFFTKSDQYSRQKLSGDLESLRSHYLDNGFINFNIESTQVSITPNKNDIYITININEGEQYTVTGVKLAGELIIPEEQLFYLVVVQQGALFSRKAVTNSSEYITERLGYEGYAFANVNSIPEINEEDKTVEITFFIDPGNRVYVRRVTFAGNNKTQDEVLRREMRQQEDAWISTPLVDRGKIRLQRLGYFDEVNVETPAVPGTPDQVDVEYSVEEKAFGNFIAGLGYSQIEGLIIQTSISQNNFFGTGKSVGFSFNNSSFNRVFSINYVNPYYTIDGISRGINLRYQETQGLDANITAFDSRVFGGGFNFGIPISESNSIFASVNYENTRLSEDGFFAQQVRDFISREGNEYDLIRGSIGFAYDTRNRAIFPTRGMLHRVTLEATAPIFNRSLSFYKAGYRTQFFHPIIGDFVFSVKGDLGYGDVYGDTKTYPFFENYYAGGPRSIRGFEENTLGPQDSFGNPLGGNIKIVAGAEIVFPIPFLEVARDSVRLSAFVDAGNVFNDTIATEQFDINKLRYSVGIGAEWLSPFGQVSVSWSKPYNHQEFNRFDGMGNLIRRADQVQQFQFNFGSSF